MSIFMKILSVILGLILCFGGFQLATTPLTTIMAASSIIPILIGIALVVTGIVKFIEWVQIKRAGGQSGVTFWDAILSLFFGILLLCSWMLRASFSAAIELIVPVLVAVSVLSSGIMRIVISVKERNAGYTEGFGWKLALGILMTLLGIFTVLNPFVTLMAVGIFIGVDIGVTGVMMIISAFTE